MTRNWRPEELDRFVGTRMLPISGSRRDGGRFPMAVPVWVVNVDTDVFVRTWYRRTTGWYGRALRTGRARIGPAGFEVDVTTADVGCADVGRRRRIDSAYRRKYGRWGTRRMTSYTAAQTTMQLTPAD